MGVIPEDAVLCELINKLRFNYFLMNRISHFLQQSIPLKLQSISPKQTTISNPLPLKLSTINAPQAFPSASPTFYAKVFALSFLVGSAIEFIMCKGGYYSVLVEAEGKKLSKKLINDNRDK